jgi:hypothetical protein
MRCCYQVLQQRRSTNLRGHASRAECVTYGLVGSELQGWELLVNRELHEAADAGRGIGRNHIKLDQLSHARGSRKQPGA